MRTFALRAQPCPLVAIGVCLVAGVLGACDGDRPEQMTDALATGVVTVDVVAQGCDRPQPRIGVGTLVADGLVLTAAHLVDGKLRSLAIDGDESTVVGLDDRLDLALVATDDGGRSRQRMPVLVDGASGTGDSSSTAIDQGPVSIVGPDGVRDARITRVLTLRIDDLEDRVVRERPALELDVVVDAGDSGSPVVDATGRIVGVVVLRRAGIGVSYATPLPALGDLLDTGAADEIAQEFDDPTHSTPARRSLATASTCI